MIPALIVAAFTGLTTTEVIGLTVFGCFAVDRVCESIDKKDNLDMSYDGNSNTFNIKAYNNAGTREVNDFLQQKGQLERLFEEWERSSPARQRDLVKPIFQGLKRIVTPETIAQMNRMTSTEEKRNFINQIVMPPKPVPIKFVEGFLLTSIFFK